jgi:hypothetical protein
VAKRKTVVPSVQGTSIQNRHAPLPLSNLVDTMDNADPLVEAHGSAAHKVTTGTTGRLKAEEQRNSIDRPETLLS